MFVLPSCKHKIHCTFLVKKSKLREKRQLEKISFIRIQRYGNFYQLDKNEVYDHKLVFFLNFLIMLYNLLLYSTKIFFIDLRLDALMREMDNL